MADRAVVVPLRRRGAPEAFAPAETFVDAGDPTRALSVSWSPDRRAIELTIACGDAASALVLNADETLALVRALVEGLPRAEPGWPRPPATVLPLKTKPSRLAPDDT